MLLKTNKKALRILNDKVMKYYATIMNFIHLKYK